MPKLSLTFACWEYDRMRAIADGTVRADGIELRNDWIKIESLVEAQRPLGGV